MCCPTGFGIDFQADQLETHAPPYGLRNDNSQKPREAARLVQSDGGIKHFSLCQALGPAAPYCIYGIDGAAAGGCGELDWNSLGPTYFQRYAQGEYVGLARSPHVEEYRIRVDDLLEFIYRVTREETSGPYELNVGDEIEVQSVLHEELNGRHEIQPDGTIIVPLLKDPVRATRRTAIQLRDELERLYKTFFPEPSITVRPIRTNTKLEDLRQTVDSRYGQGGQRLEARVTPEGTVSLTMIGSVYVQGLTLEEIAREINERYSSVVEGIEVTPVLFQRAPRYVYVVGEVAQPGRFTLEGPTTVMQAISLAGSWNVGGNLRQVVVFRRGDDWRLLATILDLRGALYGKRPTPADEIWLGDSDVVVVPKSPILVIDEFIELVFTRGIYGVLPFNTNYQFNNGFSAF